MLESSPTSSFQTQLAPVDFSEPKISVEVLKSSNRLDKMLEGGGDELSFISYSTSIDSLIDFFEMGYQKINFIFFLKSLSFKFLKETGSRCTPK